jgi:PAS domain S-box-containing protein
MELSIDQKPMRLWVEISVDPLVLDGKRHAIIAINNIDERKRAETALSLLGEELQTILDSVSASIFFKDKENRFLRVNAAFSKLMGMPKDQLQNRSIFDFYPREQAEAFWRDDKDVILSGKSKLDIIEPMQVADQTRWMQTDKVPYFNDQGEIVGVIGFAVDITERKRMDDELRKLNRTLRALSNSNRAILLAENESEYLNEACRIIVNDCGHLMTWIGFAEDDEAKTVRLVAEAGFEEGYLNTLNITWADTERGRGPTGTAIRTGKPSLCKNMLTDPKFEPWRAEALKRGYKASAVFPLIANSRSFGAVSIYSKYADPFSEDEIRLLQELVDNIAYGITVIKIRAEQVEAEAAVHRSLQRFELLAQTASELLQSSQPTELVDSLCRKVMESLDCQTFFNFLVDEKLGRLHLNAFAGIPEEDARRIEWLDFGIAVCGCAARDGCRIVAEHIPTTPDQRTELVKSFGIKAYACHPLLGKGGKVIGTLSFGTRNRETFSDEDLLLMKAVADQVSMAMIRMRDEQELQQNQLDAALAQVVTKERQRLYGVLETLPVYVVLLTPDHHISFSNKCFREHFGKDRGKCCYDLLYQRTSPCEVCETYKVLQSNAPHHWEWTGPDGRCYDVYDFPYKETDGATHIMEMGIDITDRKWAQEALLEAQQEMDRAKRLSDIGTLAATVAHELRNPLAAISMATENIRRKAQNPNLDKHLSNIALKVTESDQIINNLLFYTRLKPPHFEAINISRIIDECVEVVGKSSRKQITFAVNISDTPVKADPLQMREIFNNILNNACDAVPQEDGEINITSQAENGFIRVVVKDNGQGMSPESIKKAFDPFFTTKAKGTGLGLSVCQQIVSFHGGTIEIESELNKGTSVIISLPTGNGTVG